MPSGPWHLRSCLAVGVTSWSLKQRSFKGEVIFGAYSGSPSHEMEDDEELSRKNDRLPRSLYKSAWPRSSGSRAVSGVRIEGSGFRL